MYVHIGDIVRVEKKLRTKGSQMEPQIVIDFRFPFYWDGVALIVSALIAIIIPLALMYYSNRKFKKFENL